MLGCTRSSLNGSVALPPRCGLRLLAHELSLCCSVLCAVCGVYCAVLVCADCVMSCHAVSRNAAPSSGGLGEGHRGGSCILQRRRWVGRGRAHAVVGRG